MSFACGEGKVSMSDNVFLQEMTASVAFVDLRGFSAISALLSPMDVGVVLSRYYRHVEPAVMENEGRVVKLFADNVLALFPSDGGKDHAKNALAMVRSLAETFGGWASFNQQMELPELSYAVGIASGQVLHGDIGTERMRGYDVLGATVTRASKLVRLAKLRNVSHLIDATTATGCRDGASCIETEGAEIAGQTIRIYRLADEQSKAG